MNKQILDMTCGARTMWFDKNEPHTIYCDKRKETYYSMEENKWYTTMELGLYEDNDWY